MEKTFLVYMHTNRINGKKYIGQTCQNPPSARWGTDGCNYKKNDHFTNAIEKYGWDSFDHDILAENLTLAEADLIEATLIDFFDTMNPEYGYNKKMGGNNGFMSEEAKERISIANKGKKKPDGFGANLSAKIKGRTVSEEQRKILREKCSGWHHTEEERRKISEKNTGKHWYNNGVENVFAFKCPDGYVSGMLKQSDETKQKKSEYFSKTKWYTDGTTEVRSSECPDGFYEGRLFDGKKFSISNPIKCIETNKTYRNAGEASDDTGAERTSILRCCKGIYKQTKGLHFEYVGGEAV